MLNVTPMLSLSAFVIGFIAVLFIARTGVEVYIYYHDKQARKTLQRPAGDKDTASPAVRRYYNTHRKGA